MLAGTEQAATGFGYPTARPQTEWRSCRKCGRPMPMRWIATRLHGDLCFNGRLILSFVETFLRLLRQVMPPFFQFRPPMGIRLLLDVRRRASFPHSAQEVTATCCVNQGHALCFRNLYCSFPATSPDTLHC